jgi:hypothetical protein
MGLKKFKKEIAQDVVSPELEKLSGLKSGTIVNAYYESSPDLSEINGGGGVLLDVMFYDSDNTNNKVVRAVRMCTIGGIQSSLPPISSTAIIGFLDGDVGRPICLGVLGSYISKQYVRDNVSPRIPPKKISK